MPREARGRYAGNLYHVMTQGINKENIFYNDMYKKIYIKLLFEHAKGKDVKIIAYCIMINHAHLLLNIKDTSEMSLFMKMVNMKFAMIYNEMEKRVGVVFRNRYESELIGDEAYFYNCVNYIHNNPVKAGIVKEAKKYEFSSAKSSSIERVLQEIKNNSNIEDSFESFIDVEEDRNKIILENIDIIIEKFKLRNNIKQISLKDRRILKLLIMEIKEKTKAKNCEISKKLRFVESINNKLSKINIR